MCNFCSVDKVFCLQNKIAHPPKSITNSTHKQQKSIYRTIRFDWILRRYYSKYTQMPVCPCTCGGVFLRYLLHHNLKNIDREINIVTLKQSSHTYTHTLLIWIDKYFKIIFAAQLEAKVFLNRSQPRFFNSMGIVTTVRLWKQFPSKLKSIDPNSLSPVNVLGLW